MINLNSFNRIKAKGATRTLQGKVSYFSCNGDENEMFRILTVGKFVDSSEYL